VDLPTHIKFKLQSLLTILPDNVLAHPRAEMPQHINVDQLIPLPTDLIISQLAGARVTVPLVIILDAIPTEALSPSRPNLDDAPVTLPLHEIVAQLPPRFFTTRLSQRTVAEIAPDIPSPFQERKPTPPLPTHIEIPVPLPAHVAAEASCVAVPIPPPPEPVIETVTVKPMTEPTPVTAAAPVIPPRAPEPIEAIAPVAPEPSPELEPEFEKPTLPAGPLDEKMFLINLNRCSVEDLLSIKNVGPALAKRIIAWRTEHGRFNSIEDLRQVSGVGRKTFRALTGAKAEALNRLLGVAADRELSLQEVVRLTSKLPGLQGCMLATSDGLLLTGEVSPHLDKEAISVFAPQLFKRVARYTKELKVGQVSRFTIFTDQQPVSIFGAEDVFLVIFHDSKHFSKRLLRQCERISFEVARLCRQRTTV